MSLPNLKKLEKEAFRDSLQDGLIDLLIGVYVLILAVILKQSMIAFIAILVIFFPRVGIYLKQRYTYPRIGYVEFKKEYLANLGKSVLIYFLTGLIALVIALVASGDIGTAREWYKWMPIFFGVAFTGIFIILWSRSSLFRYFAYAALSLIGGFLFPFVPSGSLSDPITGAKEINTSFPYFYAVERLDNISYFLMFLIIFLIICGAILFAHFLATNPIQHQEDTHE